MLAAKLTAVVVATLLVISLPEAGIADPVVVYNNTSYGTTGNYIPNCLPYGFLNFNQIGGAIGDQVTLAGTQRQVTQFNLCLSSTGPTTLSTLAFSIYDFDANIFSPVNQLWNTTLTNVFVDGNTTVSISVPNVTVPDTIVWMANADSDIAGLATFNPPTVGSSDDWYWNLDPVYGWFT